MLHKHQVASLLYWGCKNKQTGLWKFSYRDFKKHVDREMTENTSYLASIWSITVTSLQIHKFPLLPQCWSLVKYGAALYLECLSMTTLINHYSGLSIVFVLSP